MQPSFSIVVPTYQRRDVVCDALRAMTSIQYAGPFEVIIVVDGSTDGTAEALAQVPVPFPIRIVSQANAGAARARNHGAELATGDVLLFVDDDMICAPDILSEHAQSHLAGADAVLGDIPFDPDSPPGFLGQGVDDWTRERSARLSAGGMLTLFDLLTGQLSIKRTVFDAIGGFDGKFTQDGSFGNEDLDIGTRLLDHYNVVFNPRAISYQRYVVTPRQNMKQWYDAGQADVAFARKHPAKAAELFELHGFSNPQTQSRWIPLARIPHLPRLLSWIACKLVEKPRSPRLQRAATNFFFIARDVVYWSGVHSRGGVPADNGVLILCYHALQDLADPVLKPYGIPLPQFESQLDDLLARGAQFISPGELQDYLDGKAGLPQRAVLLTFDDCYAELGDAARSVLRQRRIPSIAFAVSGMKSHTNEWDQANGYSTLRLLDEQGLRDLEQAGVEIGCHSVTHPEMTKLDAAGLSNETAGAAAQLSALGLRPPRYFAYPYGESNEASRGAVRNTGFRAGFGLRAAPAYRSDDPMNLPRVEILRQDQGSAFRRKTRLAFGPAH
jgi:glycosyltransferase involved in cell wall biosynthesis/peptidoglycan/xylan/chitin deacetylase (PgdA/CDA1 family)